MKNEEWELVFHFSLFTFHSSLKKKTYLASPFKGIRGGLFFILMRLQPVETEATISNKRNFQSSSILHLFEY